MRNVYACAFYLLIFSVTVLFSSGSLQEMTQIQIKLQQAQSAKALSENMNKVLQVCSLIFQPQNGTTLKMLLLKKDALKLC